MAIQTTTKSIKDKALENVFQCLPEEGFVFGGVVRDTLAGKEFNDIDIFFPDLRSYEAFLHAMGNLGYSTPFVREGKYVKRCYHEVRELRGSSSYGGPVCQIDCVIGDKLNPKGHMRPSEWDADINAIAQKKDRKVFSLVDASDKELNRVITQITHHQFRSLPGMTEFRKNKLLKKGYKEITMPTLPTVDESSFWETFKKEEGPEIAYRVAATQLVKTTKQCALLGIQAKGGDSNTVKTMTELMSTEAGDVAISALLMVLCMYTPQFNQNPKVKRLAKEFRINGVTTGANALLDTAREFLLPALMESLKKLPDIIEEAPAQVRVESSAPKQLAEEDVDLNELQTPPLKMAAGIR